MCPSKSLADAGVFSADHAGPRRSITSEYIFIENFVTGGTGQAAGGGGVAAQAASARQRTRRESSDGV